MVFGSRRRNHDPITYHPTTDFCVCSDNRKLFSFLEALVAHLMQQSSSLVSSPSTLCFLKAYMSFQAFGKVLCSLAANPQYVQPLREEVEMALGESGWTRDAIAKLRKIDSFIKEGVRFEGTGICKYFPDGTVFVSDFSSSWRSTESNEGCYSFGRNVHSTGYPGCCCSLCNRA